MTKYVPMMDKEMYDYLFGHTPESDAEWGKKHAKKQPKKTPFDVLLEEIVKSKP